MSSLFIAASSVFGELDTFKEYLQPYMSDDLQIYCKKGTRIDKWLKHEFDLAIKPIFVEYNKVPEVDNVLIFWDGESLNVKELIDKYPNAEVVRFMNMSKELFLGQISRIKNEKWREGCEKMLDKIPKYFWVVSACSSSKYHPTCDLGMGGLLRHSTMVCVVGEELVRSEAFIPETDLNYDLTRIACLFHDCIKQGFNSHNQTVFEHPILSANFVREHLKDYIETEYLDMICGAIETHSGKWTTSNYAPNVTLRKPSTDFEKLVHMADYVASREFIGNLEGWNYWPEKHVQKGPGKH